METLYIYIIQLYMYIKYIYGSSVGANLKAHSGVLSHFLTASISCVFQHNLSGIFLVWENPQIFLQLIYHNFACNRKKRPKILDVLGTQFLFSFPCEKI